MDQPVITWTNGRAMVPIYDVIDNIRENHRVLSEDAKGESVYGAEHVAFVTGTLVGMEVVVEWLEDLGI